ncbi:NAD(P)/FAD-dependent oxidoreductase [Thermophilibacter provencensis]|uniref:FAD-dependent oxidoreductase n=1 Tax=Thermophilibacter provencensis TaxID=1852386 RepID=A0ABT7V334_9ACTN|nr:FAD-dependent oxidoreductase [Thermophilibacter provencensis]MDM8271004.1 FAD-dependent oxidoreductase [Thermophilibacter provencensis]
MSQPIAKELVIIGGGPAGLTAAIYAQRSLLDAVTLEREAFGGQVILTSEIDNYPGVPHADGYSLTEAMRSQAVDLGAQVEMDVVSSIAHDKSIGRFLVSASGAAYDAASVILAAGAQPRRAGFEGEEQFAGHGVSYCATCDGMFYRNKQVFVIGGGNSAAEEALFLARLASKVTLIVRKDHLRAQTAVVRELERNEKVEIRLMTSVVAVRGNDLLTEIELRDNQTGSTYVETYDEGSFGVFVLVGRVPETELIKDLVELDESGYAITDERMATTVPGLFVAGDARSKPLRQIVTAASDGAIAASAAAAYLGRPIEG